MGALLDPSGVRALADSIGLRPSKRRGQNFVVDANTVRRLVGLAGVGPDQTVLEIGPGLGSLTLGLLEAGAEVVAVEIDPVLARLLPQTVAERAPEAVGRLVVLEGDALRLEPSGDGAGAVVPGGAAGSSRPPCSLVANLPYNVAVPVLLHVLERFGSIGHGLVMVQSEVADRLVAAPGSRVYGAPSVKLAWWAQASRAGSVSARVFWPVPNVESGLVRFERWPAPVTAASRETVFAVVDAAFAQRRKMLRVGLAGLFGGSSSAASAALERAGVAPTARGETLDVAAFARIAAELAV